MKFEVTLDIDEATVPEVLAGIENALEVLQLENGDQLYADRADLLVAWVANET